MPNQGETRREFGRLWIWQEKTAKSTGHWENVGGTVSVFPPNKTSEAWTVVDDIGSVPFLGYEAEARAFASANLYAERKPTPA